MSSVSINSNLAASTASRNLATARSDAQESVGKLTTGRRAASPKDDAAGLAVANKLKSNTVALQQAGRNASQGSSVLNTAEGGMSQISDMLTRMKELSVQVVNQALGSSERDFANTEFTRIRDQVTDISEQTRFGDSSLLNGSERNTTTSAFNSEYVTNVNIESSNDYDLSGVSATGVTGTIDSGTFSVSYDTDHHDISFDIDGETFATDNTGGTELADASDTATLTNGGSKTITITFNNNISGDTSSNITTTLQEDLLPAQFVKDVSESPLDGVKLDPDGSLGASGEVLLARRNEGEYALLDSADNSILQAYTDPGASDGDRSFSINGHTISLKHSDFAAFDDMMKSQGAIAFSSSGGSSFEFQVGTDTGDTIAVTVQSTTASALGIDSSTIDTVSNAQTAQGSIDTAITTVNEARANLGAAMRSMQIVEDNLAVQTQNTDASRASFIDANLAEEMTEYTRAEMLAQTSQAMHAKSLQSAQQLAAIVR